ncbi:arylesterase [Pararhodobacter oceanensis]|nr:arylesterase [Pararhodobacter oceanensis]
MQKVLWFMSRRYGVLWAWGKHSVALVATVLTLTLGVSVASAQDVPQELAQGITVTALGDSLTQGYGLAPEAGLVPQLQAWLTARGHMVNLVNAGVSGDTTAGGLSRLDWTLAERPDAMIVALGGNDLLRGLDPGLSRDNLAAILARLQAEGIPALLIGMPAPRNYGPEYQAEIAALYPELAEAHDALLVEDMLAPLAEQIADGDRPDAVFQGDNIHPNPAGVALIVAHIGPQVEALIARVAAQQGM